MGERERVNDNKYGEKRRRADALFQQLVLEPHSGCLCKTTAKIIQKLAMLAGRWTGSDPVFLH
jgi:hypothetical protein